MSSPVRITLVNRKMLVLSLSISVLMGPAAFASADDDLEKGIKLYESGKVAESIALFKNACQGECHNPAAAHYYLANALIRSQRLSSALVEYERAYELDPIGKYGEFSKRVLKRFNVTPKVDTAQLEARARAEVKARADAEAEATRAQLEPKTTDVNLFASFDERLDALKKLDALKAKIKSQQSTGTDPAAACCPTAKPTIDIQAIAATLPKLPKSKRENPDPAIFLGVNVDDRAGHVTDAYDRRWRAADKVSEAKCLLENAESAVNEKLGDDKSQATRKAAQTLLRPYKQYLADCESDLKREDGIMESCNKARQSGESYWPF